MVDGVGVCSVCAPVCHAGHDVTYSKHGSFFCDCGAKEDGTCLALHKRTSSVVNERRTAAQNAVGISSTYDLSSNRSRASATPSAVETKTEKEPTKTKIDESVVKRRQKLAKNIGGWKEVISDEVCHCGVAPKLLDLMNVLLPAVESQGEKRSSIGKTYYY